MTELGPKCPYTSRVHQKLLQVHHPVSAGARLVKMFCSGATAGPRHCPTLSSQQFCVCFEAASALSVIGSLLRSYSCQRLPECFVLGPLPTPTVADAGQATVYRGSLHLKARGLHSCHELRHTEEGSFHEVQNHTTH